MRAIFLTFLLCCISSIFLGEIVGLLGEEVPWVILNSDSAGIQLSGSPVMENLEGVPKMEGVLYGFMKLGNGEDDVVSIALVPGNPPQLWVDANNNENLADDEHFAGKYDSVLRCYVWDYEIMVEYEVNGERVVLPVHVEITVSADFSPPLVSYSVKSHRRGLIEIDGKLYTITVSLIYPTEDRAVYALEDLVFGIDRDGDGMIYPFCDSYELFPMSFPESRVFCVGDRVYTTKFVTSDGRKVVLEEVKDRKPADLLVPPILRRGYPAPDFKTRTLDDEEFSLSAFKGCNVALYFAPSSCIFGKMGDEGCCCGSDMAGVLCYERLEMLASLMKRFEDFVVVWIITDETRPETKLFEKINERFPSITVIWDPEVVRLYLNPRQRLLIIGKDGIMKGGDEVCIRERRSCELHYGVKYLWEIEKMLLE